MPELIQSKAFVERRQSTYGKVTLFAKIMGQLLRWKFIIRLLKDEFVGTRL